jgi:hypothetical protein
MSSVIKTASTSTGNTVSTEDTGKEGKKKHENINVKDQVKKILLITALD